MDQRVFGSILTIITIVSILLSALFFSNTGITSNSFFTINIFPILAKILTINFVLFLIFGSIALATILTLYKLFETPLSITLTVIGYFIGVILGTIIFAQTEFLLMLLIGLIGIIIAFKLMKKKEIGFLNLLKQGTNVSGKIILFIAIGLFVSMIIISIPNKDIYEKNFVDDLLKTSIGNEDNLKQNISEPILESTLAVQKETINSMKLLPGFSKLSSKSDSDVLAFVNGFDSYEEMVNSEEYKELLRQKIEAGSEGVNIGEQIIEELPIIERFSRYAWIIYPLMTFILALIIGSLIIKHLTALFYVIILKILDFDKKDPTEENQKY